MKLHLRTRLTISYIFLSVIVMLSVLILSNYIFQVSFRKYIINSQEKRNQNLVEQVTSEYGEHGEEPSKDVLMSIGHAALNDGQILMVSDNNGRDLFCMTWSDDEMCSQMINDMKQNMASVYPGFQGQYSEKKYDIIKNQTKYGNITIGYYGPFFYNNEELEFIKVLNQAFLIVTGVLFLLAVLLGAYMAKRISGPIKKVIDKTRQIETGDFKGRISLVSKTNEIDQLVHSVNHLAETLERQQISQKRMAGDYAHEFCTPLAALQSSLEAMIDGIWEPDRERLESCREEILRLTRMVSDIDKIVKIENESIVLDKTLFDLTVAVEQVVRNFENEMNDKSIQIKLDLEPCVMKADRDKIVQVIINLLSNAIKYTGPNGVITIIVKKNDSLIEFVVADSGIGISEQDLPNIFEHLYRADKSRDRNTGGSGIGLSVVKAIIEAHGGRIFVKSKLGKGSRFTCEFHI